MFEIINKDEDVKKRTLKLFQVLSNETRFKILLLLCKEEMNVTDFERVIGQSQTAISHQLSLLRSIKLVKSKRIGREMYYSLSDKHVDLIIDLAINHVTEELS